MVLINKLLILLLLVVSIGAAENNGNGTTGNNGNGNNGDNVPGATGNDGHAGNNGNGTGANGNNGNNGNTVDHSTDGIIPSVTPPTTPVVSSLVIEVQAKSGKDTEGTSLGVLAAGKTITFQYVEGRWTAHPPSGTKNPDKAGNNKDLNCPTPSVCYRRDGVNIPIGKIGLNTASTPWSVTLQESGEVIVNMNCDAKYKNNWGRVVYKVEIR